eukprot:278199-Prymnesium_polylepis.1
MLQAAIQQVGDGVFLDVLTYSDLQALKSRKGAPADGPPALAAAPNSRNLKRYVILTYAGQFDRCAPCPPERSRTAGHQVKTGQEVDCCLLSRHGRVHYPLPLSPDNSASAPNPNEGARSLLQSSHAAVSRNVPGHAAGMNEPTHRQLNELLREK